jgi:hypothetical protein
MTQAMNEKIHTCTKCGTRVWKFMISEEETTQQPAVGWILAGAIGGILVARLFDRGQ